MPRTVLAVSTAAMVEGVTAGVRPDPTRATAVAVWLARTASVRSLMTAAMPRKKATIRAAPATPTRVEANRRALGAPATWATERMRPRNRAASARRGRAG